MIMMGFRIPRGTLRGIEEGTFYVSYASMGYAAINHILQPMVLWGVTAMIEDAGYEAVPIPNNFPWTNTDSSGQDLSKIGVPRLGFRSRYRPTSPRLTPSCHACRLHGGPGEIGWSKMFMSP